MYQEINDYLSQDDIRIFETIEKDLRNPAQLLGSESGFAPELYHSQMNPLHYKAYVRTSRYLGRINIKDTHHLDTLGKFYTTEIAQKKPEQFECEIAPKLALADHFQILYWMHMDLDNDLKSLKKVRQSFVNFRKILSVTRLLPHSQVQYASRALSVGSEHFIEPMVTQFFFPDLPTRELTSEKYFHQFLQRVTTSEESPKNKFLYYDVIGQVTQDGGIKSQAQAAQILLLREHQLVSKDSAIEARLQLLERQGKIEQFSLEDYLTENGQDKETFLRELSEESLKMITTSQEAIFREAKTLKSQTAPLSTNSFSDKIEFLGHVSDLGVMLANATGNAKVGKMISSISTASLGIATRFQSLAQLGSSATTLQTFNAYMGAATLVFGMVNSFLGSDDDGLTEALYAISKQIQQLTDFVIEFREEVNERFDHIEKMLGDHHIQMMKKLTRLTQEFQITGLNVQALRREHREILNVMGAQFRTLIDHMSGYPSIFERIYSQEHVLERIRDDEYAEFLQKLYELAAQLATNENYLGYKDPQALPVFGDVHNKPFSKVLGLITNQLLYGPETYRLDPTTSGVNFDRIINPDLFLQGTRGYLTLRNRIDKPLPNASINEQSYLAEMRRLSENYLRFSEWVAQDPRLFQNLIRGIVDDIDELQALIRDLETRYLHEEIHEPYVERKIGDTIRYIENLPDTYEFVGIGFPNSLQSNYRFTKQSFIKSLEYFGYTLRFPNGFAALFEDYMSATNFNQYIGGLFLDNVLLELAYPDAENLGIVAQKEYPVLLSKDHLILGTDNKQSNIDALYYFAEYLGEGQIKIFYRNHRQKHPKEIDKRYQQYMKPMGNSYDFMMVDGCIYPLYIADAFLLTSFIPADISQTNTILSHKKKNPLKEILAPSLNTYTLKQYIPSIANLKIEKMGGMLGNVDKFFPRGNLWHATAAMHLYHIPGTPVEYEETLDPETQAENRRYMLSVLQRGLKRHREAFRDQLLRELNTQETPINQIVQALNLKVFLLQSLTQIAFPGFRQEEDSLKFIDPSIWPLSFERLNHWLENYDGEDFVFVTQLLDDDRSFLIEQVLPAYERANHRPDPRFTDVIDQLRILEDLYPLEIEALKQELSIIEKRENQDISPPPSARSKSKLDNGSVTTILEMIKTLDARLVSLERDQDFSDSGDLSEAEGEDAEYLRSIISQKVDDDMYEKNLAFFYKEHANLRRQNRRMLRLLKQQRLTRDEYKLYKNNLRDIQTHLQKMDRDIERFDDRGWIIPEEIETITEQIDALKISSTRLIDQITLDGRRRQEATGSRETTASMLTRGFHAPVNPRTEVAEIDNRPDSSLRLGLSSD